MNYILIIQILYVLLTILVVLRVIYDTRNFSKTLAYILLVVFVPIFGIFFYFSFGVNYRKRKIYSKKIIQDKALLKQVEQKLSQYHKGILQSGLVAPQHTNLIQFLAKAGKSTLTANNQVELLTNGEHKFPAFLESLENANQHIHIQYYIYEDDFTGKQVAEVLKRKAQEGVEVRFMYDDFGSHSLGKSFKQDLEDAGVHLAPFYKIIWYAFANRINYRNHRKIVIIDGETCFVGGINVSDRYRNDAHAKDDLYWRDTHLKINGAASFFYQFSFISDWNFCSEEPINNHQLYFPSPQLDTSYEEDVVQMASSGPDSDIPVIYFALIEAISAAQKCIYITSPYFIPGDSLMDALIIAAQKGVEVKILVPGKSDSKMVNLAARSYYTELLKYGVEIYLYQKGFVHAKTLSIDNDLAIVGSANMDYRSFDLNFEANAMVYSRKLNIELKALFFEDLENANLINPEDWLKRSKFTHLIEKCFRLLSPFL